MKKHANKVWRVPRRKNKAAGPTDDIAADLEAHLVLHATELLHGSGAQHSHKQLLRESANWVQEQCQAAPGELENEALTTILSAIRSWLAMRRYTEHEMRKAVHAQHRQAIMEELAGAGLGIVRDLPFEIRSYAFTQHALRELRAHTSM